jgi:hypothetical protein
MIPVTGTTKTIVGLLTIVSIVSCASAPQSVNNPIAPITINCPQATQMSAELEYIIQNPNSNIGNWTRVFASLSGHQTAQQRISSAKNVLWTIRTRCPGY